MEEIKEKLSDVPAFLQKNRQITSEKIIKESKTLLDNPQTETKQTTDELEELSTEQQKKQNKTDAELGEKIDKLESELSILKEKQIQLEQNIICNVLYKGRHKTFDELVQRANDFASSIPEELKTKIGNVTEKPFYNDQSQKCKVHPMGNHFQTECRLKCKLHPWGSHRDIECFQKQNKMQNQENTRTCPKERYGKHGEPFWCLFCNTVTPKFERHKCFHCWKCSKEDNAILSRHCPCDKTYKKPQ